MGSSLVAPHWLRLPYGGEVDSEVPLGYTQVTKFPECRLVMIWKHVWRTPATVSMIGSCQNLRSLRLDTG